MARMVALLRAVNVGEPPIFVRLRDVNTLSGAKAHNTGLNSLTPFGDLDALIAASEFLSDAPDHAARAFSTAYRATLSSIAGGPPFEMETIAERLHVLIPRQ